MDNFKFIVKCERIGRRSAYSLTFPFNEQLVDRIKNLTIENRKWNAINSNWELKTTALYELIKSYRGSTLIKFDFGNDKNLEVFKNQLREIDNKNRKTKEELKKLIKNKEKWLKVKKEVDENYLQYEGIIQPYLKEGIKLFPHQVSATIYLNEVRNALISHEMGLGKAQDLDSKLLTPNGWVRMGDIMVDDFVIGSDGKPKKVLGVYPQGIKDIYEVKFNDGTSTRSCDEHLWNVNTATRNWSGNSFFTKTLKEIIDGGLQYKNGNNRWYIPIVSPIEFEEKDLKIDPYILGCILGDGGLTVVNLISFINDDDEVVGEIQRRLPEKHNLVRSKKQKNEYYLTSESRNIINQALKYYSLGGCSSQTKHIPDDYKFSSIEQRLEILQGLLDTNGYSRKDGTIEITLASKQLIKDIQFIVQSLGGIGRLNDMWIKCMGEDRLYYRLHVKLPPQFIPFKLQRKIETFVAPTKYKPHREIVDVEYVGRREAQCILIDSDDHLYATDNCILTHNTLSSIAYSELNEFKKVFVITPNSLKFNYYNEVEKFTNSKAHIVNWKNNKYTIEESKYIIVNYEFFNPKRGKSKKDDKFLKKWDELGIDKIDTLICDECFEYNTKILTTVGEISIGDIVENNMNVDVLSYNHKSKRVEPKPIMRRIYNGRRETIRVVFSNGVEINCTPEHKFYSVEDKEYKSIKLFNKGDKIYYYEKKKENTNEGGEMPTMWDRVQAKGKFAMVVFTSMFNKLYSKRKRRKKKKNIRKERGGITNRSKSMSNLSKKLQIPRKEQSKILFNKLFCKMENVTGGDKSKGSYEGSRTKNIPIIKEYLSRKTRVGGKYFNKNEKKQSNVQGRKYGENERKNDWENVSFKRWEWTTNKTTNCTTRGIIENNRSHCGVFSPNKKTIKKNGGGCQITTNTLQNRHWNPIFEIGDRGGWENTQNKEVEISRQAKDRNIGIVRLENIEVLESGSGREFEWGGGRNKKVFDLEILDNHNYFANGVLVSNCHRLKNTDSNTYKNFKRIFTDSIFRDGKVSKVFLSGTPAPNRAYELYTVLNQISPIDFPTKSQFYEYYCGMKYDFESGWGYIANTEEAKFEELYEKISPYTHRKRKDEVLKDLPEKTYQRLVLEMNDKDMALYDDIESGIANEFVGESSYNPLTIMLRLRQYTSHLKAKLVTELIENILDSGEKVVVVDVFKESLYELYEKYNNISVLHTGDEKDLEVRGKMVEQFQDPKSNIKIFLASTQTANYGLTLTAASKLIILTMPFSLGEYDQVSDRLHRIGQENAVNIYVPVFPDTIDDHVYSSIESKRAEILQVIDNIKYKSETSDSVMSEVIEKIKRKHGK